MSAKNITYSAKLPRHTRWFSSVFLKSLRGYRVPILGWGLGLGVLMAILMPAIPAVLDTAQKKQDAIALAHTFSFLWEPVGVDTAGGYALWKYGFLLTFPAIWGLLAGSRLLRGEEERGSLDVLLSLPRSRSRVALEKLAALGVAILLIGLLVGILLGLTGVGINAPYSFGDALLLGLDISLVTAAFAAIALFVSQFTHEQGSAAGFTGAFFGLAFLLNSLHIIVPSAENLSRLSPIYYFGLSKPIIPSYGTNPGAMLILAGFAAIFTVAGVALFLPRDVGASIRLLPAIGGLSTARSRRLPAREWTLRSVYARSVRVLAFPTLWWALATGFFAGVFTLLAKQSEKNLAGFLQGGSTSLTNVINALTGGGDITTNAGFIAIIFGELPLIFAVYALIQASAWANDEENGRFELVLATPQSRRRVMLARYGAFVTSLIVIAAVILVATLAAAAAQNLALDYGKVVEAAFGVLPIALVVGSVGYLIASWVRSSAVTGILGTLLAASLAVELIGALLSWPDWTQKLSIFTLYGSPLVNGIDWGTMTALVAVAVVALGIGVWRFANRDVAA